MAAELRAAVTQAVVRCRPENTLYAVVFSENLIVTFLEKKAIPLEVDDMLLRESRSRICTPRHIMYRNLFSENRLWYG